MRPDKNDGEGVVRDVQKKKKKPAILDKKVNKKKNKNEHRHALSKETVEGDARRFDWNALYTSHSPGLLSSHEPACASLFKTESGRGAIRRLRRRYTHVRSGIVGKNH